MDQHIKNQLKDLPKIALTAEEKVLMRENLTNFMSNNPVVNEQQGKFLSGLWNVLKMQRLAINPLIAVVVIVVGVGSGTSFAAQTALPGDVLYPYKIHVNENVKVLLALSVEEEAQAALDLAEERLKEAAKLAAEDKLSAEIKLELKAKFKQHARNAFAKIDLVKEDKKYSNASDLLADFEDRLRLHVSTLASVKAKSKDDRTRSEVAELVTDLEREIKLSSETRATLNAQVIVQPDVSKAVEGKLKAVENKLDTTQKLFSNKKASLGVRAQAQVEAQIEAAKTKMVEGQAKIEADAYGDAFGIFQEAQKEAQEALIIIHEEETNIDIEAEVNMDLKPVDIKVETKIDLGL